MSNCRCSMLMRPWPCHRFFLACQAQLHYPDFSSPFYSFINEYITISIAFPSMTALLRRIPSIMKPFFSKNIIKYNNYYINIFRIFRRGISIEYENTTESASVNKYLSAFRCICNHCPAERKRSTSKPGLVIQSAKCFRRSKYSVVEEQMNLH